MTDLSWRQRAIRRGGGVVLIRPDAIADRRIAGFHRLATPEGERILRWQPGVERWQGADGSDCPAERAGAYGWRYLGPFNA